MRRKYNLRKIITKRSYTPEELAETLGVHLQTIRDWRRAGMQPLPETKSPYLFLGSAIKVFLTQEKEKHSAKLDRGEFYCFSCRKGVKPQTETIEIKEREQKLGNGNQAIYLQSRCPICSTKIVRFSSNAEIARTPPESVPLSEPPKIVTSKQQNSNQPMQGQRSLFDSF